MITSYQMLLRAAGSPPLLVAFGLAIWLNASAHAAEEVTLNADCGISIVEQGPFDAADGLLSDLLERYLLLVLDKQQLSGQGERVRFVLQTRAEHWRDLPSDGMVDVADADAFEIAVAPNPEATVTITGQTPLAVGFGVMHFLDKYMGVLWAFPGADGLCLPKAQEFRLPVGVERVSPWVVVRVLSGLDLRIRDSGDRQPRTLSGSLYEHRGFFLADDYFKSLRLRAGAVTHNMIHVFPVAECLANHPEVFPITEDGARFVPQQKDRDRREDKSYQAWHPCYTNPKTLAVAIEKGRQVFENGLLFFSLGINDGRRVQCQCESCRQTGWPQSYYRFVNQVADALREYYPPQMVGVLAYGDVGIPPADLKLRENVLVNVAGLRKEIWDGKAPALGTYEYIYGAGYVIPNLPLEVFQENMRYYQARGLRMYRAEFYPVWAFDAPKAFIVSRLLWDPNQDVYRLLREYCDRAFGQAGEPMFRYYEHLASIRSDDVQPGRFTPIWDREWPFREPLQMFQCPPDLHRRLTSCLDQAGQCELSASEQKRLDMVAAFTEFSDVYYQMHGLKETVFTQDFDAESVLAQARRLTVRREAVIGKLEAHPEWFAGSAVTADTLHDREWPTLPIEHQLQAAVTTARSRLQEQNPTSRPWRLSPLMREEHAWYKPTQFARMRIQPDRTTGGFQFQTTDNTLIREDDDPRHDGKPRAQWLHANVRDLDVRPGVRYALTVDLQGADGLLRLTLQGTAQTVAREKLTFAECLVPFHAGEPQATSRRVIFDPGDYLDNEPGASSGLPVQLLLVWRPDDSRSRLAGSAELRQIVVNAEP